METITCGKLNTGLNNQRMCLVGLFSIAVGRGAAVSLPKDLVNFTPRAGSSSAGVVAFEEIFDFACFLNAVSDFGLSTLEPDEVIPMQQCFRAAGPPIVQATPTNFGGRLLLGLQAAAPLQQLADDVSKWLAARQAVPLQLRIERDWQNYLTRKGEVSAEVRAAVDPEWIFTKIRRTPALAECRAIWACCDDDDLALPQSDIKAIGRRFDLDILFKADLPATITLPQEALKRSMVDFTVCRGSDSYVGLTASSFSRMVLIMAKLDGRKGSVFFFDQPGDSMTLR